MGLGGISIWQLLIILVIIILLFGTRKLRNLGGDLGSAVKSFRGAMKEGEKDVASGSASESTQEKRESQIIEGQAEEVSTSTEQKDKDKV